MHGTNSEAREWIHGQNTVVIRAGNGLLSQMIYEEIVDTVCYAAILRHSRRKYRYYLSPRYLGKQVNPGQKSVGIVYNSLKEMLGLVLRLVF